MSKHKVYIEISDDDSHACSNYCPFLDGSYCMLFHLHLEDTQLKEGYTWNNCNPTKVRNDLCKGI